MDNLGFDPHGAYKHDSTYTTLSIIHTKEIINVDVMVKKK
jgi:hypothetical protein